MKRKLNPYQKGNLILRLLEEGDLHCTLSWRNYEEHRQWFVSTEIISFDKHVAWFHNYSKLDTDFIFIIEDKQENRIGQLSIYELDDKNKQAKFGRFVVNPAFSNLGMMKTACNIGMELAKEILQIQKLILEVKQNNQKAIHIYQSAGFEMKEITSDGLLNMELQL